MATPGTTPGIGRYIVQIDDAAKLQEFVQASGQTPGLKVVDLIGPAGKPHTVVVELPEAAFPSLEQQLRDTNTHFLLEPDRKLSPF
ncbi:hypothetical protein MJ904_21775 [Massilia sp. MB5]|uniref:hypothetical protein n=1 Tax=unclassified Massilia TaxID=2609279 RepID=UPI00067DBAB1|nr:MULTISPECIES: hypothetical protein [unclassified Massilia]AKU20832.1 hypothetical protein ACZ75_04250 [Massilia sp. NR 4-1]UMR29651.1 hypothetical protein MJ904_21775 [Massilia sp. MB5]